MKMKIKKQKIKKFEENECPAWRWILVLIVGFVIGIVISNLLGLLLAVVITNSIGLITKTFEMQVILGLHKVVWAFLASSGCYIGTAIAIRLIAKTSLKSFVFGVGGKLNKKESLKLLGLYFVGLVLCFLIDIKTIRFSGVQFSQFLVSFLLCLIFVWMQTTWEELIFRGLVLRAVCKNDIAFNKKSFLAGLISSLVFSLLHIVNPELTSQQTLLQKVLMALTYFCVGLFLYISDLFGKSLMPGILIHWVNNFFLSTIIRDKVSALETSTVFIDYSSPTGFDYLVREIVFWLPVFIFYFYKMKKGTAVKNISRRI